MPTATLTAAHFPAAEQPARGDHRFRPCGAPNGILEIRGEKWLTLNQGDGTSA